MFMFLLLKRKKIGKKMITGISGFVFFVEKWPFRDANLFFKKCLAETPIFIVFGGARLLGQVVKKRKFWTPTLFCFYLCVFFLFSFILKGLRVR